MSEKKWPPVPEGFRLAGADAEPTVVGDIATLGRVAAVAAPFARDLVEEQRQLAVSAVMDAYDAGGMAAVHASEAWEWLTRPTISRRQAKAMLADPEAAVPRGPTAERVLHYVRAVMCLLDEFVPADALAGWKAMLAASDQQRRESLMVAMFSSVPVELGGAETAEARSGHFTDLVGEYGEEQVAAMERGYAAVIRVLSEAFHRASETLGGANGVTSSEIVAMQSEERQERALEAVPRGRVRDVDRAARAELNRPVSKGDAELVRERLLLADANSWCTQNGLDLDAVRRAPKGRPSVDHGWNRRRLARHLRDRGRTQEQVAWVLNCTQQAVAKLLGEKVVN